MVTLIIVVTGATLAVVAVCFVVAYAGKADANVVSLDSRRARRVLSSREPGGGLLGPGSGLRERFEGLTPEQRCIHDIEDLVRSAGGWVDIGLEVLNRIKMYREEVDT